MAATTSLPTSIAFVSTNSFLAPASNLRRLRAAPNVTSTPHIPPGPVQNHVSQPSPEKPPLPTPVLKRSRFATIIDMIRRDSGNLTYSPKYGPVYQTKFMGRQVTMVSDLRAIAEVYRKNDLFSSSDGAWPTTMETLFGPSTLFITDGVKHDTKRAIVQPAFTSSMIQNYFPTILESTYRLWDDVSDQVQRRHSSPLIPLLKDHFLRIIIGVTTGLEMSQETKQDFLRLRDLYVRFEYGIFSFTFGPIWNNALAAREQLLKFYDTIIRQRLVRDADTIEQLRASGDDISKVTRKDLKGGIIDILTVAIARSPLRTGPNQDLDPAELNQVTELMLLLWFAGYSTQATTASSCVMELGFNDSIRTRLKAEQNQIIESYGSTLTINQVLKEMPLLDSYINEVIRLYPVVATMPRRVTRDTMICGHLVKKGTSLGLDSWWAQRDPAYFEDAAILKVDRFIGDNAPMTVGFGAKGGSHYCLGAALAKVNLKVTLAILLRDYTIELDRNQSRRYVSFPAIQPASGVKVLKCKRNK